MTKTTATAWDMENRHDYFINTIIMIILFDISLVTTSHCSKYNPKQFAEIVRSAHYVDKTEYIASLLEENGFSLTIAPPRFGKTTILSMMKAFLEIEVNERGEPITMMNLQDDPITDTPNFKLFSNHNLSIVKHKNVMYNYLGKTPVIRLDFGLPDKDNVTRLYDAVRLCKNYIHNSFKEHEYLSYSEGLTEDQRQYSKIWCDSHSYKTMVDFLYVSHGLQSLVQYLYQHFKGRQVFVLFDNYDQIIQQANHSVVDKTELNAIVNYVFQIISDVTKGSVEFLCGSVVTGVADITTYSKSHFANFTTYSFGVKNKFSEMWIKTK